MLNERLGLTSFCLAQQLVNDATDGAIVESAPVNGVSGYSYLRRRSLERRKDSEVVNHGGVVIPRRKHKWVIREEYRRRPICCFSELGGQDTRKVEPRLNFTPFAPASGGSGR